jgi:hypothetical protein
MSNTSTPSKKTISIEEWEKKLADVKINKQYVYHVLQRLQCNCRPMLTICFHLKCPCIRDLNKLVMNYLVVEGYKDAAEQFSIESGIAPMVDIASIQDRMDIRRAVQSGNVDAAIERVNDLNPDVRNKRGDTQHVLL